MPKIQRTFPTAGPVPSDDLEGREDVLRDDEGDVGGFDRDR